MLLLRYYASTSLATRQSADQLPGYLSSPQYVLLPAVTRSAVILSPAVMRLFAPTASPAPPVGSAIYCSPMGGLLLYICLSPCSYDHDDLSG